MKIASRLMQHLIFGPGRARRFTQDSPVLPEVWLRYGAGPRQPLDLLLTPHRGTTAGETAKELRRRLATIRQMHPSIGGISKDDPPQLAYAQGNVVARLYFDELVRAVLPLTDWWKTYVWATYRQNLTEVLSSGPSLREALLKAVQPDELVPDKSRADLAWMIRVTGTIAHAALADGADDSANCLSNELSPDELAGSLMQLISGVELLPPERSPMIWLVNLNRQAEGALTKSVLASKADAARRLFQISCRDLTWAVIDSGIDAAHYAFRSRDGDDRFYGQPVEVDGNRVTNRTRIIARYDFTRLRELCDPDHLTPRELRKILPGLPKTGKKAREILAAAAKLRQNVLAGKEIDWTLIGPLLEAEVGRPESESGLNGHGTHVAGILAADGDPGPGGEPPWLGMCPDIRLYDLRVLDGDGQGSEFGVIAALQFVRSLNAHQDYMVIHGVNLSLSIPHEVANYACGRTPVCEECERVASAGVVVVAAAGNNGFSGGELAGVPGENYQDISITDPGNAEGVITVGATHRYRPHTYGVSYFSSRGPTADGRLKPDLVAPGEKITAPVPEGKLARKDGTSMAAPHVSGAAALLMARHSELAGDPSRIKRILCQTATDLGRHRNFQGHGMLDVLRALQSI